LTVTAKDKDTGKEQKITISGSTQLSKEEVDRMIKDAEAHADEDKRRREEIETVNLADSIAYQVERQLQELGNQVPANEKARAEQMISEIRSQVKNAPPNLTRLRQLTSDLQQMAHSLVASASAQQSSQAGDGAGTQGKPAGSEDVVDAEFKKAG
jgi:molecular chaperone DnaK